MYGIVFSTSIANLNTITSIKIDRSVTMNNDRASIALICTVATGGGFPI